MPEPPRPSRERTTKRPSHSESPSASGRPATASGMSVTCAASRSSASNASSVLPIAHILQAWLDLGVTGETDLRAAWDTGDMQRVATLAIGRYGPEILGVLTARLRSSSQAAEVFSVFAEDLW